MDELDAWEEMVAEGEASDEPFEGGLAPDDLHKDNISGGSPYAVALPDPTVSPSSHRSNPGQGFPVADPGASASNVPAQPPSGPVQAPGIVRSRRRWVSRNAPAPHAVPPRWRCCMR